MENNNTLDVQILLHNIAFLRQHHNLSKKKMAQALHISVESLNKIERGILPERLSAEVLVHLANRFNYTTVELLTRRLSE